LCRRIAETAEVPDQSLAQAFAVLVAAVEAGFGREEQVMEGLDMACLRDQRQNNALILSALHHAAPAVESGDLALGRKLIAALRDLLDPHRLSADLALAPRGQPPAFPPGAAWYGAPDYALAS
jgi:hemerythrin